MKDIFSKIPSKENKKIISVTIDADVFEELMLLKEKLKIQEGIKSLSPIVNLLIKDWLNNQKEEEKQNEQ